MQTVFLALVFSIAGATCFVGFTSVFESDGSHTLAEELNSQQLASAMTAADVLDLEEISKRYETGLSDLQVVTQEENAALRKDVESTLGHVLRNDVGIETVRSRVKKLEAELLANRRSTEESIEELRVDLQVLRRTVTEIEDGRRRALNARGITEQRDPATDRETGQKKPRLMTGLRRRVGSLEDLRRSQGYEQLDGLGIRVKRVDRSPSIRESPRRGYRFIAVEFEFAFEDSLPVMLKIDALYLRGRSTRNYEIWGELMEVMGNGRFGLLRGVEKRYFHQKRSSMIAVFQVPRSGAMISDYSVWINPRSVSFNAETDARTTS